VDARTAFRQEVEVLVAKALVAAGHDGEVPALETPPDAKMGDLGLPCFPLARTLKKAPVAIASDIAETISLESDGWVVKVAAVGPYVNFWMDHARNAATILDDPKAAISAPSKAGKVLIEHTSANPNGPLHVGRARNPILGDTIVRLARTAGHDVEAHYYMDNLGRQVAILAWGFHNISAGDLPPLPEGRDKSDHDLVRYYQAANEQRENNPLVAEAIKELVTKLESADVEAMAYVRPVYERCFEGMTSSLERLGVFFDSIDDESDHVEDGAVQRVIDSLKESSRARVEEDGANYLDMEAELKGNKSTKFFFTRRDQTSVYATRDVAYHQWKSDQVGSDGRLVDILGEDHRLQALQVGVALDELGARRPDVSFYAFVSLPEGKMSTRANRVVFLDDLLDEAVERATETVRARRGDELSETEIGHIAEAVGMAAIRYNIVKVQPEKPIKFRWEDALDFEGDSAPYLMYAHARAKSLLRRADVAGVSSDDVDAALLGDGEVRFLATLARLPSEAQAAFDATAPHRFCAYAMELAGAFNEYYRDHPVVQANDPAVQSLRRRVVEAAVLGLESVHQALGIPVLDNM
jgi:arginyl-tRNA synthetase